MTAVTALADVDICNMALSELSISIGVQSLNPPDQSAQAKVCAFWYPKCRDQLLRSAPWNFAYTSIALASDATVFPGWRYAYQYPNDCLQGIAVTTAAGQRLGSGFWSSYWWPYPVQGGGVGKIPFKVVVSTAVAGQKAILCDLPAPAYLFYIQCVTNTAMFDPMFCDTLALEIAAKIGGPLRADAQKVQACAQGAAARRLEALAQTMNEGQQDMERVSPSISARW